MQTDKKNLLLPALSLLLLLSGGCPMSGGPAEVILQSDFTEQRSLSAAAPKRFQQTEPQGTTVVETAMELSKKYAKLSEEAAKLRAENQNLITQNNLLEEKLAVSNTQLRQTQKEISEANDLLMQMRIELNNWKVNVLGFREEMRQADKAQLETLLKILKVLGGEVRTESVQNRDKDMTVSSPADFN